MLVLHVTAIISTLNLVASFPTESIPVNDLNIGSESPPIKIISDVSLEDDLIFLDTAGRIVTTDSKEDQVTDMSADIDDFIGLIPIAEVRTVIANYYRNDPEVREGFSYMKKAKIINQLLNVREVKTLVGYLNETGFNVEYILKKLADVLGDVENYTKSIKSGSRINDSTDVDVSGGMHVMVDAILEVIPQDEVLNMFFEKMDSSVAFTTFFNNIHEPSFGYLLHKLEDSSGIKYVIYDLHNHGINMEKIVDSLKNYFFLGTFN